MEAGTMPTVRRPAVDAFIDWVERVGNKLPHPFIMFAILSVAVLLLSQLLASLGVSVTYTAIENNNVKQVTVAVKNLLERKELQLILKDFVKTYATFTPLGFVLVMVLGVGVAEKSGLISAVMQRAVFAVPSYLVTFTLALVGVCANIASDAGIVFTPAIGGAVFAALKRNPLAGVCVGYAAALGGFSANLLIAGTDVLLSGITTAAATAFGIQAPTHPLINWYIMMAATPIIALVVTLISEAYVIPRLGPGPSDAKLDRLTNTVTPNESMGLKLAGVTAAVYIVLLLFLTASPQSFLRNDSGQMLPRSPFIDSIVPLLFMFFVAVGIAYGLGAGTIGSINDVPKLMQAAIQDIAGFIVVCFTASIFINLFSSSNIATIIAVKGAHFLQSLNLSKIALVVGFVLLCAFMEIFITSGTAKWLVLAPIFVPMLYMMGINPAVVQMAYRIGDSAFNIISPLTSYIAVVLGLFERYSQTKNVGIGTVISLMLPYSVGIFLVWTTMFVLWLLLGLPLGPGVVPFHS